MKISTELTVTWFGYNDRFDEYEIHYSDGTIRTIDGIKIIE